MIPWFPININSLNFSTSAVFAPFQGSPLNGTVANPLAVLHQTDSETAGEEGWAHPTKDWIDSFCFFFDFNW